MRPYVVALLVTVSAPLMAQPLTWEAVPLTTADVRALTVLPNGDVYVASRGGLERSLDGGNSWSHWLTTGGVSGVAYSVDNVLFVGHDGLCRTDDATYACGRISAWEDIGGGSLALGGSVGNVADVGSRLAGVVAAPDGRGWAAIGNDVWAYRGWGPHWERSELPVDAILGLHRGAGGRLYASSTDGLFAFDPDIEGSTWERIGLAGYALRAAFEGSDGTVFAGSVTGTVFQASVDGTSWHSTPVASTAILSLYAERFGEREVVFAGTAGEGLFLSVDGGATWRLALGSGDAVPALGGGDGTVWASIAGDGLRRSDDGGLSWQPVRWSNLRAQHVEAGPGGLVVAGDGGPYGLFAYARSTNTWRSIGLAHDAERPWRIIDDVIIAPDGRLYAVATEIIDGARRSVLYRSIDAGTTWETAHTFPSQGPYGTEGLVSTLAAGPTGTLIAGTGPRAMGDEPYVALLYRSADGGTTWQEVATLDAHRIEALAFAPDGTAYAGVGFEGPELFRSNDGGQTWSNLGPVATGENVHTVMALAATDDGAIIAALNAGTYRSTDRGATWQLAIDRNHRALATHGRNEILAGGSGVHRSSDGGRSWEEAGIGYPYFRDLAIDAFGMAYVAFSRDGLFRSKDSAVAVEGPATHAASSLSAYPNPFARATTIEISLDVPGYVEISIYDVLGRRVAVLHRGALTAGAHPIVFDRGDLPAGVYIVRATAPGLTLSKRVLLVR